MGPGQTSGPFCLDACVSFYGILAVRNLISRTGHTAADTKRGKKDPLTFGYMKFSVITTGSALERLGKALIPLKTRVWDHGSGKKYRFGAKIPFLEHINTYWTPCLFLLKKSRKTLFLDKFVFSDGESLCIYTCLLKYPVLIRKYTR